MNNHRLFSVGIAMSLAGLSFSALLVVTRAASVVCPANVAPQVWEAAAGGEAEFLVVLAEQADLGAATTLSNREARLRSVYDALRETALRTQADLRAELDDRGVEYRPFYIVNMLAVKGDRALVLRLAARSDVARIVANPHVRQALPEGRSIERPFADVRVQSPQAVEWNVAHVNADDVWALGYNGQGIVVAGQDTGYDWDHPALVRQYRGYNGVTVTHDYNWHDAIHADDPHTPAGNPCGFDSAVPCDDNSHGTHTMGSIVGDDGAGNQIGVAPGARWIGCRNMEQGWGTPASYAECFQFFLAPYPIGGEPFTDGVPSLAPHVINNSWTCPLSEGCDWSTLQAIVEKVRAAGIVVVASAGNDGSACSTVAEPIALYDAAFSVGATDSGDNIAGFSSRGPVTADGSGRLKPDVSAPGVGVRSSLPGGGYGSKSGTSMAGPHVVGTVALLWSAQPALVGDVDMTEWIIAHTARPRVDTSCGGEAGGHPNNVYGWGIVDALAAVRAISPGLTITKQAVFPAGLPARLLVYTIQVTNTTYFTLTQIVLTDTIPPSTTFAWASGDYTQMGGVVTWTSASLVSGEVLTATLAITIEHLPRGTHVANADYGVGAGEVTGVQLNVPSAMGAPVEAVVPWRVILLSVFRDWAGGDNGR
jgi:serine protease AprX